MAYDGKVTINTEIITKGATSQMMSLENRIVKTANKITELKSKMNALESVKIPTQEYTEIKTALDKANAEFDKLLDKQFEMQALGKTSGNAWDNLQVKLENASNSVHAQKNDLEDLVNTGKTFTLGKDSAEYQKLNGQLKTYERDMTVLTQKHVELTDKQNKTGKSGEKAFGKINNATKKTGGLLKTLATRFKGILLSLLIFNWITKGFNAMISGIKDGVNNYVKHSEKLNKTMSDFATASNTLKNSLGVAFAPILNAIVPAITTLINYLVTAINYFSQFAALISGKASFTKAITQQKDYAKSLGKSSNSAKKLQGALASFDTLEVLNSNNSGGGGGADMQKAFEEVKIPNDTVKKFDDMKKAIQPVIDRFKELAGISMAGFLDGIGESFTDRIQNIKDNLKSIKDSLKEIFSDPDVVSSFNRMIDTWVYAIAQFVGSIASIGVTIAQNITGGISKYLESSKDFIKDRLVEMFDISSDIGAIVGNFSDAFAYVFEAFGSESGQRVTGALIGIFVDLFLTLTELVMLLARDILNVITQPFIDNKELLKTTIEKTLSVIADVLETIKKTVEETSKQIFKTYDESFKPFFDSLADGFSEIFTILLESYNKYFLPVLQNISKKFSELMENIQPHINNFIILIGKIVEVIKLLWENVLLPFIEWLLPIVIALISDIVNEFVNTLFPILNFFGELVGTIINTAIGFFEGLITFLTGVFSGNWKQAWEGIQQMTTAVWEGIKATIKTIVNAIIGIVNKMIEATIAGINAVIKALNTIQVNIPSWVPGLGGKSFGVNLKPITAPKIPYLANGAVIQGGSPFLAMLGDQPKGQTNIEAPAGLIKDMAKQGIFESGILDVMKSIGSGNAQIILDGEVVGRLTLPHLINEWQRADYSVEIL